MQKFKKKQKIEGRKSRQVTYSCPVQVAPGCHCLCHWEYAKAVEWPVIAGKTHPEMPKRRKDWGHAYSVQITEDKQR